MIIIFQIWLIGFLLFFLWSSIELYIMPRTREALSKFLKICAMQDTLFNRFLAVVFVTGIWPIIILLAIKGIVSGRA